MPVLRVVIFFRQMPHTASTGAVPAGVLYEWRKTRVAKQPLAIARSDGEPLASAGLWEAYRWSSGETTRSFCIITTEPNALMVPIHDRMPVVLEPVD